MSETTSISVARPKGGRPRLTAGKAKLISGIHVRPTQDQMQELGLSNSELRVLFEGFLADHLEKNRGAK